MSDRTRAATYTDRLMKGIRAGQTVAQARGHLCGNWTDGEGIRHQCGAHNTDTNKCQCHCGESKQREITK